MKAEDKKLIRLASKSLSLNDIVLLASRFERPSSPPEDPEEELLRQYKRGVGYSAVSGDEGSADRGSLNVTVGLGTRLVRQTEKSKKASEVVAVLIEAEYLITYGMTDDIPDKAIEVFAKYNAVHNVWPFWRHHVFDICQRARLPDLKVPLIEPTQ
ncbi:MAG: hypothetical protein ACRESR_09030 [Gammaproteobacteria bacterium]